MATPHPLLSRFFVPLFITQFLGALNDNIFKNALMIFVLFVMPLPAGGQVYVTAAAGVFILPFVIFSAAGGFLSDTRDKARVMRVIKGFEVAIMMLGAAAFYMQSAPFLLFVLFLLGVHSAFFSPAKYSILPQHLGAETLLAGNGFLSFGTFAAILLGTMGGALGIAGVHGVRNIACASLLVALAGLLASFYIPPAPPAPQNKNLRLHPLQDSLDMLKLVLLPKEIRRWSIAISWFWFLGATYLTQFPNLARKVLYADEKVVTLFLTMFTIGVAAGSLLCSKLLRDKVSTRFASYAALALVVFGSDFYAAAKTVAALQAPGGALMDIPLFLAHGFSARRLLFDLFMTAVAGGVFYVPLYARVQQLTEPGQRARVMGGISFLNAVFMVFSSLLGMALLACGFSGLDVILSNVMLTIFMVFYCRNPQNLS